MYLPIVYEYNTYTITFKRLKLCGLHNYCVIYNISYIY